MGAVLALAWKDLLLLLRDKVGVFFVFVFPLVYGIFFGMIFSGQGGETAKIGVVVADVDQSEASRAFVESLRASGDLEVREVGTREEALELVRRGKRAAAVVTPQGFGERSGRMFWGEPATVELAVDPSRKAEAGMLEGMVLRSAFERMQETFGDPKKMQAQMGDAMQAAQADTEMPVAMRSLLTPMLSSMQTFFKGVEEQEASGDEDGAANAMQGFEPIRVERVEVGAAKEARGGPENSFGITFPQAAMWGVLGATAGFAISLVTERTRGTLVRLRAAPVRRMDVLLGKALACYVTVAAVILFLLAVSMTVFGLRIGSPGLFVLAVVSVGVCFVGIMMLLATVAKTEAAAGGAGWAVLLVMAMLGGGMIPLFFMPRWMQTVSHVSPVKWGILAIEGAVWRGFTLEQMLLPCGVLVGIGAVGFSAGAWLFARGEG
ncbi:MAG: ABC transporter permease [Phycisphaerales bacterium]